MSAERLNLPLNSPALAQPGVTSEHTGATFRVGFPCDLKSVRDAVAEVHHFLASHHVADEDLVCCDLALAEACNNAVLYAPSGARHLPVIIEARCNRNDLELHVIDHTAGFAMPRHNHLPGMDSEHGRGLFIIQSLMTDTYYLRGEQENRLVMRRRHVPDKRQAAASVTVESMAASHRAYAGKAPGAARRSRIEEKAAAHELEVARSIQQSLLPASFPHVAGFQLAGFCLSARHVGGDFYDVVALDDGNVLLVIADVMGKGVPAALFAATLRTLIRTGTEWTTQPGELLKRANRLMYRELSGVDMFITVQVAVLNPAKRSLVIASAGHCPVLISTPSQPFRTLSPDGMPLGILPEVEFGEEQVTVPAGGCLVFYTDGVIEACDQAGEPFGDGRLLEAVVPAVANNVGAAALKCAVVKALSMHQAHATPRDDQTLLVLADTPRTQAEWVENRHANTEESLHLVHSFPI